MHLGKRCKYANECPVFQEKNNTIDKPIYIIKNVFCNRGIKGWSICKRFQLLEEETKVDDAITPYG